VPYKESVYQSLAEERGRMWWGAFGKSHIEKDTRNDLELTQRALRIARFDKMVVAVFNVIACSIPFFSLSLGSSIFGLTSAISLSLVVTFGFTVLYSVQTLSSFVGAKSSALMATLPLAKDDFSLIMLCSFVRSVDFMVVGSILSQVLLVAFLTMSPLAILSMLAMATMNAVFAVAVALWFSRLFYKNLLRGGRSKFNTVLRLFFILMWGTLLMGIGFLFSVPWYIVPHLEIMLLGLNTISSFFLGILYPFSAAIVVSNFVYQSVAFSTVMIASLAIVAYLVLAGLAGRWTLQAVKRTSEGTGINVSRSTAKDFSIKTRNPMSGYVIKDLKIASRNPATAFFFALPVLETVTVSLLITNMQMLRTSMILVATATGGVLALFMPLALLSAEGTGLEYTKTLPVNARRIIVSKTLITTATYAPVPLTLLGLALMKQLTSPLGLLIPCAITLSIASASVLEIKLFLNSAADGRIGALVQDIQKLVVAVAIVLIPEVAYGATYLASLNHLLAVMTMSLAAIAELALAVHLIRKF